MWQSGVLPQRPSLNDPSHTWPTMSLPAFLGCWGRNHTSGFVGSNQHFFFSCKASEASKCCLEFSHDTWQVHNKRLLKRLFVSLTVFCCELKASVHHQNCCVKEPRFTVNYQTFSTATHTWFRGTSGSLKEHLAFCISSRFKSSRRIIKLHLYRNLLGTKDVPDILRYHKFLIAFSLCPLWIIYCLIISLLAAISQA